jgi:hypothetical protein
MLVVRVDQCSVDIEQDAVDLGADAGRKTMLFAQVRLSVTVTPRGEPKKAASLSVKEHHWRFT